MPLAMLAMLAMFAPHCNIVVSSVWSCSLLASLACTDLRMPQARLGFRVGCVPQGLWMSGSRWSKSYLIYLPQKRKVQSQKHHQVREMVKQGSAFFALFSSDLLQDVQETCVQDIALSFFKTVIAVALQNSKPESKENKLPRAKPKSVSGSMSNDHLAERGQIETASLKDLRCTISWACTWGFRVNCMMQPSLNRKSIFRRGLPWDLILCETMTMSTMCNRRKPGPKTTSDFETNVRAERNNPPFTETRSRWAALGALGPWAVQLECSWNAMLTALPRQCQGAQGLSWWLDDFSLRTVKLREVPGPKKAHLFRCSAKVAYFGVLKRAPGGSWYVPYRLSIRPMTPKFTLNLAWCSSCIPLSSQNQYPECTISVWMVPTAKKTAKAAACERHRMGPNKTGVTLESKCSKGWQ